MRHRRRIEQLNQHRLVDNEVIERLVSGAKQFGPPYLEIGAADGNITRKLAQSGLTHAVEIDPTLVDKLKGIPKVRPLCDDVLRARLPFFRTAVGNIPFSITEALLHRLIRVRYHEGIAFIIGSETAHHLIDLNHHQQATRTAMLINTFWRREVLEQLPRDAFDPPPSRDPYLFVARYRRSAKTVGERILRRILTSDRENVIHAIRNGYLSDTNNRRIPDYLDLMISSLTPTPCRVLNNTQLTKIWRVLSQMWPPL